MNLITIHRALELPRDGGEGQRIDAEHTELTELIEPPAPEMLFSLVSALVLTKMVVIAKRITLVHPLRYLQRPIY